ncbi:MAG: heme exporter protein CcmD [Anaerolineales bacterium]
MPTPDTVDYLIAGYAVGFAVFFTLVASIWWRYRMLKADQAALETLEQEARADQSSAAEAHPVTDTQAVRSSHG